MVNDNYALATKRKVMVQSPGEMQIELETIPDSRDIYMKATSRQPTSFQAHAERLTHRVGSFSLVDAGRMHVTAIERGLHEQDTLTNLTYLSAMVDKKSIAGPHLRAFLFCVPMSLFVVDTYHLATRAL